MRTILFHAKQSLERSLSLPEGEDWVAGGDVGRNTRFSQTPNPHPTLSHGERDSKKRFQTAASGQRGIAPRERIPDLCRRIRGDGGKSAEMVAHESIEPRQLARGGRKVNRSRLAQQPLVILHPPL